MRLALYNIQKATITIKKKENSMNATTIITNRKKENSMKLIDRISLLVVVANVSVLCLGLFLILIII